MALMYSAKLELSSTREIAGSKGIHSTKIRSRIVARRKSGMESKTRVTTDSTWSAARSRFSAWMTAGMTVRGK